MKGWIVLAIAVVVSLIIWLYWRHPDRPIFPVDGKFTVADRLAQFGPNADSRLIPLFKKRGVAYPPDSLAFLIFKQEKRLAIHAGNLGEKPKFITTYPILAASGKLGPKLREGDRQVPEGLYRIEWLNPNSLYHLSLRINYPNAEDREQALKEGRSNLGGDIMIHGGAGSVGCVAMGDPVSEDLFILAARTGIEKISVILSPCDFRAIPSGGWPNPSLPWVSERYQRIRDALQIFDPSES